MTADELDKLSEKGYKQYLKYIEYYKDKYQDYGGSIDFVSFVEHDAEEGIDRSS